MYIQCFFSGAQDRKRRAGLPDGTSIYDTPHVCGSHVYYIIVYYTCRCTMPQPPGVPSSYLGTGSPEQIIIACI